MNNKGFTLVELLAVLIILSVIITIVVVSVEPIISGSKDELLVNQKHNIEEAAKTYYLKEGNLNATNYCVNVSKLISKGYVETSEILNPKNNKPMEGSVQITYISNQYKYEYKETACHDYFSLDDWQTIAAKFNGGDYSYKVGDTKDVNMGIFGTHAVRIANITPCDGTLASETACGFVLEFVDIITTHKMNPTFTNVGGWPVSSMRTYINNDIYNALPEELKNIIIDTTVVSGHGSTSGETNFTSTDKLYLLSTKEVLNGGTGYDTAEAETRQLDYYANNGVTTSNTASAIKKDSLGSASVWWLRSAYSCITNSFFYVSSSGGWNYNYVNITFGVSPAFRIG